MKDVAYIALGSNLGQREVFLAQARGAIAELPGTRVLGQTEVEETAPIGPVAQGPFLNQMIAIETELSPGELLTELRRIEAGAGRVRRTRWGPRTLDLDIVLFEHQTVHEEGLSVPHPELSNRDFWLSELATLRELALNSTGREQRPVTVRDFAERKRKGEKIVVMTAYDALFGRLVDEAGVDAILVGDSVGTAVMGHSSTLPVTLEHMIYHASAVRRGVKRALIIIDMPFLSYQASIESAVLNCGRAIQETGVSAVKVEGGSPEMLDTVHALVRTGIPVMAHIGFTPQSVNTIGGARVQGREEEGAERLIGEAKGLEEAGAFGIVLELVPAAVSARITAAVGIPTIGIGAGAQCDGQVLVLPDVLGLNDTFQPKFLKRYAEMAQEVRSAIGSWAGDVRSGAYPDAEHSF